VALGIQLPASFVEPDARAHALEQAQGQLARTFAQARIEAGLFEAVFEGRRDLFGGRVWRERDGDQGAQPG